MKRIVPVVLLCSALGLSACSSTATQSSQQDRPSPASTSAPGVSTPDCSNPRTAQAGLSTENLTVNGTQRSYQINIPASYDGTKPTPVVMTFHGRGSNSSQQLLVSGFEQVSDQNGFILIAPSAIDGQWDLPANPSKATTDATYVAELLEAVSQRLCTDPNRTYASGFSLGSAFTLSLACAPTQTFAAFGGVGASFYRSSCDASPPAPIIYFHGTQDETVPFNGGRVAGSPRTGLTARVTPATDNMQGWATHNGCASGPSDEEIGDTTLLAWTSCTNDAVVDFYRVNGGGHTWPGTNETIASFLEGSLGKTTQDVNASELMWEFFEQYQLPSA